MVTEPCTPSSTTSSPTSELLNAQSAMCAPAPMIASRTVDRSITAPPEIDTLGPTVESLSTTPLSMYTGSMILDSGESYLFEEKSGKSKTICRYIMFSCNVDHDGDRYGFVRNMRSAQDEYNARRSRALTWW